MAKSITYPAVAKFGNATTNQAKALAAAAIELVKAMTAKDADADAIMVTAKADFDYDKRDAKGQSTWRTFQKKALRVAQGWSDIEAASQKAFLAAERGASLDTLFKGLTAEGDKAKREASKAEKEAQAQAAEQALREEIVAELGGKMQVVTLPEMMLHIADFVASKAIGDMSDDEAGALNLLRDAINTACAAEVERLAA